MVLVGLSSGSTDNPAVAAFREWTAPQVAKAERKEAKRQARREVRRAVKPLGVDRDVADRLFAIGWANEMTSQQLDEARMTTEFREHREMVTKMMAERAERDRLAWPS